MGDKRVKTLANLLRAESTFVNGGFCYCDFPHLCFIDEAIAYAKGYAAPKDFEVFRNNSGVDIFIKAKNSDKKMKIQLWY